MNFNAKKFWDDRLRKNFNLHGVGTIMFDETYNSYLYRIKEVVLSKAIRKLGLKVKGKKVLDVGTGTGFFINFYNNIDAGKIVGIDVSRVSVRKLKTNYKNNSKISFFEADFGKKINSKAFKETFDIINIFDILYHIVDDKKFVKALENINNFSKKGSIIFITDTFRDDNRATHVKYRSLKTYENYLSQFGFETLHILPLYHLLNNSWKLVPNQVLNIISVFLVKIDFLLLNFNYLNRDNVKLLVVKKVANIVVGKE